MSNPIREEINQVLAVLAMIEVAARSVPEDDTSMSRVLFDAGAALQGIADRLDGALEAAPAPSPAQELTPTAVSTEPQLMSIAAVDKLTDIENVLRVCVGSLRDPAFDNSDSVAGVLVVNVIAPLRELLATHEDDSEVAHG